MRQKAYWIGVGLLIGLLLVGGLAFTRPYTFRGSLIEPAQPAPEIILQAAGGKEVSLSDFQGKLVLIFFGYTTCPDVCPITLAEMKNVFEELGPKAENVQVLFITVDPQRDSPERMAEYVSAFHPDFIGLSGSDDQLAKVWSGYGVFRQINQANSATGYLVDHSARTYLIDQQGNMRLTYVYGTPVDDIVSDLRALLKEG